jgi:hypothetical protein
MPLPHTRCGSGVEERVEQSGEPGPLASRRGVGYQTVIKLAALVRTIDSTVLAPVPGRPAEDESEASRHGKSS